MAGFLQMIFKNKWTSLGGLLAVLNAVTGVLRCWSGTDVMTCLKDAIPLLIMALIGLGAKDGNVTGGTVAATEEAVKRVR